MTMTRQESDALLYSLIRQHPDFTDLKDTDGVAVFVSVRDSVAPDGQICCCDRNKVRQMSAVNLVNHIRSLFVQWHPMFPQLSEAIVPIIDRAVPPPLHKEGVLTMPVSVGMTRRVRA